MIRHGFYKNLGEVPDLYPKDKPLRIEGYTQTDEPPVYYWIVSLPLRILGNLNIDAQLYATRFVSLLLYLVTILAGIGITREITSDDSPLRWMVPLSMALLPSFTDLMTAVNDDVGAVTVFTLFLWTSVRLLKHGFRCSEFLLSVSLVILGYFTKKTTLIAIPLLIIVVIYILLPRRWRKFAWIGLGIVALAGCTATFSWGDSA